MRSSNSTPITTLIKNVTIRDESDKVVFRGEVDLAETLARIEANGQVAFRYCGPDSGVEPEWCPNGSLNNIAGPAYMVQPGQVLFLR